MIRNVLNYILNKRAWDFRFLKLPSVNSKIIVAGEDGIIPLGQLLHHCIFWKLPSYLVATHKFCKLPEILSFPMQPPGYNGRINAQ